MTPARLRLLAPISFVLGAAVLFAAAAFAATVTEAPTPAPAASTAAKDHSLFVGMDYSIKVNGKYRHVIGAGKRSFIVDVDGAPKEIYAGRALDIRMTRGVKLSNLKADVVKFSGMMTSEADVAAQFQSTGAYIALTSNMEIQQNHLDAQIRAAFDQEMYTRSGAISANTAVEPTAIAWVRGLQNDAMTAMVQAAPMLRSQLAVAEDTVTDSSADAPNTSETIQIVPDISASGATLNAGPSSTSSAGTAPAPAAGTSSKSAGAAAATRPGAPATGGTARAIVSRAVRDASGGHPDRIDFEMELSSPEPLDHAYFILVTEFSEPSRPTELHNRVYVDRLPLVGAKPQKIKIYERDYPVGFQLRGYTLSVYSNGQEVATNYSPNRVALTSDEAYQYVALDYLSTHKGETHPPAAILMTSRSRLRALADANAFHQPVYVSVDQEGKVVSVSESDSANQPVSPAVARALQEFRFVPALNKGTPAAGRAKIVLAEFAQ